MSSTLQRCSRPLSRSQTTTPHHQTPHASAREAPWPGTRHQD